MKSKAASSQSLLRPRGPLSWDEKRSCPAVSYGRVSDGGRGERSHGGGRDGSRFGDHRIVWIGVVSVMVIKSDPMVERYAVEKWPETYSI
jgi:hypothetical protein